MKTLETLAGKMREVNRWRGAPTIAIVLPSLLTAQTCFAQMTNRVHVQLKDLPEAHIRLIGPSNPARDHFLNFALHGLEHPSQPPLNPAQEMNVESLKPVMVVLANNSDAAIVAYSIVYAGQDVSGQPLRMPTRHIQPYALRHGDTAGYDRQKPGGVIGPKRQKIVTPFGAFDEQTGLTVSSNAEDASDFLGLFQGGNIQIELDAVILDDGSILGPDTSNLVECFKAYLFATQDVLEHLVDGGNLEAGISSKFRTLMSRHLSRTRALPSTTYAIQYEDYKSQVLDELQNIQELSGDDKVRLFVSRQYTRYMGVPQLKRRD